jgi:hypothetical protein
MKADAFISSTVQRARYTGAWTHLIEELSMNTQQYNGWTNYETWLVSLWMDNEEGSQNYWTEIAQECYDQSDESRSSTKEQQATYDLSKRMEEEHEENQPETTGLWADLINAALSEVNWYEIAEHYIEEVEKDVVAE